MLENTGWFRFVGYYIERLENNISKVPEGGRLSSMLLFLLSGVSVFFPGIQVSGMLNSHNLALKKPTSTGSALEFIGFLALIAMLLIANVMVVAVFLIFTRQS
jgi:hypothetical protein